MSIYVNTRPELSPGITTLPAKYYTDPAHFAAEMEHIHFDMWLCATSGKADLMVCMATSRAQTVGDASNN